jgi:LPS export ABC transporter protein LptC
MNSLFRLRHLLLLLAIGLALVLAAVVMKRYQPPLVVPVAVPALPAGVDLALQKIDYTHTEGGVARWRLVASRAEHQAESKFMLVKDLELTFFDVKGAQQMSLKARNGEINSDYSAVDVKDDVELFHRNGYVLRTDSLRYNQGDGMIRTDAPVRLTGPDVTLDGVGLRVDLAKRQLHVLSRVRAVVSREPS